MPGRCGQRIPGQDHSEVSWRMKVGLIVWAGVHSSHGHGLLVSAAPQHPVVHLLWIYGSFRRGPGNAGKGGVNVETGGGGEGTSFPLAGRVTLL